MSARPVGGAAAPDAAPDAVMEEVGKGEPQENRTDADDKKIPSTETGKKRGRQETTAGKKSSGDDSGSDFSVSDLGSEDEEDSDDDSDDEDFKETRTRGKSVPAGEGAKIVDGKVVTGNEEEGDNDESSAAKRVRITPSGAVRADRQGDVNPAPALLEALREYVEKCGGRLSDEWACTATMRTQGASAGSYDALYWAPDGKRYRSRLEVVRALGLAPQKVTHTKTATRIKARVEPISREAAVKKSQENEQPSIPYDLGDRLVITKLGEILNDEAFHDEDHIWPFGFTTQWTNDGGVVFTSTVTRATDGEPEFVVSAVVGDKELQAFSASPLGAWIDMCDVVGPTVSVGISDHFSFEDVRVVRAIEGLPGSDKCTKYRYVEERGGWDDERVRRAKARLVESKEMLKKLREVVKKEKIQDLEKSKVEREIERVLLRVISRVDNSARREKSRIERLKAHEEAKKQRESLKEEAKKQRDALKEAAKAEREAAKEAAKMQREALREKEKLAREEARLEQQIEREKQKELAKERRAKEAEEKKKRDAEHAQLLAEADKKQKVWLAGVEDREEDSADTAYSPPLMTANLKIEPEFQENSELGDILEAWMFLDRFKSELFGSDADVKSPPTVQALAKLLSNPKEFSEDLLASMYLALITPYVADVAASVDQSSSSALLFYLPNANSHISEKRGVWQEVVRRFLHGVAAIHDMPAYEPFLKDAAPILPEAADVFARYMCAGNAGMDPLSHKEGSPWNGHPVDSYKCRVAPGICAQADAEALAAAEVELYSLGSGAAGDSGFRVMESRRSKALTSAANASKSDHIHAVRCALRNSAYVHALNQVCRRGDAAAVKGQQPRGLDLRMLDARLAAGVYCIQSEDNNEMDDMIRADTFEAATTLSHLTNGNGLKAKKDLIAAVDAALKLTKESNEELPEAPWDQGCSVCGLDVMSGIVLLCDCCDAEYHTKCLDPPLTSEPEGEWFCPKCTREKEGKNTLNVHECQAFKGTQLEKAATGEAITVKDALLEDEGDDEDGNARPTGGSRGAIARRLRSMARALDSVGFDGLSPQVRLTLMRTLMNLALDSSRLKSSIENGVHGAFEIRKGIRQHIKAWSEYRLDREDGKGEARDAEEARLAEEEAKAREEQERAEREAKEAEKMEVDGENGGSETKPSEQDKEKKKRPVPVKKIEKIPTDEEIAQARVRWQSKWHEVEAPVLSASIRREPLGSDRHKQRYWALGNWGELIVQAPKDAANHETEPNYGVLSLEDTKSLIGSINPKGRREGDLWRALQRRYGADPSALPDIVPIPPRPVTSDWGKDGNDAENAEEGIARVKSAFLTLESEIPDAAFDKSLGSDARRKMWRNLAAAAQSLPSLTAAIIVFERAIDSDWLHPGWLPWSWLSPLLRSAMRSNETSDARSLRLHLVALRRAFKWNKATRVSDRINAPAVEEMELQRSARTRKPAIVEEETTSSDDEYEVFSGSESEEVIKKSTAADRRFRL